MKCRNRVLSAFAGLLVAPGVLLAQSPAPNLTGAKVGIINMQTAVSQTGEGKKALGDIQAKYQARGQQLQQEQQEIQSLNDQLQRQAATLSDDEHVRLTRQLNEKQTIFKRAQEDYQTDFQDDEQDAFRRIRQKMDRLISEFAQQNGYMLILEGGPQMPIYYAAPQIDVTDEIVRRYDTANPSAAAAPSGTAAPSSAKPNTATKPPATKPAAKPKP